MFGVSLPGRRDGSDRSGGSAGGIGGIEGAVVDLRPVRQFLGLPETPHLQAVALRITDTVTAIDLVLDGGTARRDDRFRRKLAHRGLREGADNPFILPRRPPRRSGRQPPSQRVVAFGPWDDGEVLPTTAMYTDWTAVILLLLTAVPLAAVVATAAFFIWRQKRSSRF